MPHYIYIAENKDLLSIYKDKLVVKIGITEQCREHRQNTLNGFLDKGVKYASYKDGAQVLFSDWLIKEENYKQVSSPVAEDVIQESVVKKGGENIKGHYRPLKTGDKKSIELYAIPSKGRYVKQVSRVPKLIRNNIYFGGPPSSITPEYDIVESIVERDLGEDVLHFLESILSE